LTLLFINYVEKYLCKIVITYPGNELLAESIAAQLKLEMGEVVIRQFPDMEFYVRIIADVNEKDVILIANLERCEDRILPLYFLCRRLKDSNVRSITLVAPYLSYMRQDKQFNPGEAVTSTYFASLLSSMADRLITIDPHLHRFHQMSDLYTIPCTVIHAAPSISSWIRNNIKLPLLVGPDSESEQWVAQVAKDAGAPYILLEKTRLGDRKVKISVPNVDQFSEHTPILVDDIISTGKTMIETVHHLIDAGMKAPVCIGIHALFAGNAYEEIVQSGVSEVITCNTIVHSTNNIDLLPLIIPTLSNL
jgi:ribose-phosphate pyrophosphokinase